MSGTFPKLVQLAIRINDNLDNRWQAGQLNAFCREDPRGVRNSGQTLLPCFVAMGDNLETMELEEMG